MVINSMLKIRLLLLVLIGWSASVAHAESLFTGGEWTNEFGTEFRKFREIGSQGQDERGISFTYNMEYFKSFDNSNFVFKPYLRVDQHDPKRTHFDLREAYWAYFADNWDFKGGFLKVYWGRLEFSNIVDVINQDDFVDNQDEKLGQPMAKFSWVLDQGILDVYLLTGFRERTFPGADGRLRLPILVDDDASRFENDMIYGLDFALRWVQPVGDLWEVAVSHFHGMSREPTFSFDFNFSNPHLIPVYEQIDQTGLEAEMLYEGWAFKFEAINVFGQGDRFYAVAGGLEYTWGDIFGTGNDLTWVFERIHDSREKDSPGFLERDYVLGARWAANDEAGTEGLFGMLYDPQTKERLAMLEGSRRLGAKWKVFLRASVVMEKDKAPVEQQDLTLAEQRDLISSRLEALIADPSFSSDIRDDLNLFLANLLFDTPLSQLPSVLSSAAQSLDYFEQFSDKNHKLSALENDDYVELQIIRYF